MHLLVLAVLAASSAPTGAPACPVGKRVKVDLDAWKKSAPAAKDLAALGSLIRAIGLDAPASSDDCPLANPVAVQVDVFHAAVVQPEVDDAVIQVRGSLSCGENPGRLLLGAVLHPSGPGAFCAIPLPFLPGSKSLLSLDAWTLTFGFTHLLGPKQQAFEVREDELDQGTAREETSSVEYWVFRAGRFESVFSESADSASGGFTGGASSTVIKTSVVGDEYPRKIELTLETHRCGPSIIEYDDGGEDDVDPKCHTKKTTTLHCLVGGQYAPCGKAPAR